MPEDATGFSSRLGAKIRAVANDIKRNTEALSAELGEEPGTIEDVFAGSASAEVFDRVIKRMVDIYPLSRVDLEVKRDDTDDDVVVWPPEKAQASSRVFARENALGQVTPFYEYRDVAMSSVGPYRPEWIKTLRVVSTDDPNDPDVAYNSGHLMHQLTFFVGPVNFYWKDGSGSHVAPMNTGDSNYITPFVPHSYTSRDASQLAYIVAVTFPGKLQNIQQELAVLDPERIRENLLDLSDRRLAFAVILQKELASRMLSAELLASQVDVETGRMASFLDGNEFPSTHELYRIASQLGTNVRDLLPPEDIDPGHVVVKHSSPSNKRHFPSDENPCYQVEDLASSRNVPSTRGIGLRILTPRDESEDQTLDLAAPAHEFAYNHGREPAILQWQSPSGIREAVIEPEGSCYIKPSTPHALRILSSSRPADMFLVRVGGSFQGDAHLELSNIPRESLHRVFLESQQWYDPKRASA